jgi:hypothetical protein
LTFVPSGNVPAASMGRPSGVLSRHTPAESKFSNANPTGSMFRWHDAHTGFARCVSTCCRVVCALPGVALLSSVGTFGGGCGGGVFRSTASTYLPRIVGDVRLATAVRPRTLPSPSKPRRFGSGICTRRNRVP